MEFDPDLRVLRFASDEEVTAFHAELTALLREVTISVSSATDDAQQAKIGAREILREFKLVTRILNAVRRQARQPR